MEVSHLSDKIKRDFFQAVAALVQLYRCTSRTLTKCMEKKIDGNYTKMLPPTRTYLHQLCADIVLRVCRVQWKIGTDGERESQGNLCLQRDLMMIKIA